MKRKTLPIVLTSLLLGLVFDWLFYRKVPGISIFLYASLILGSTFYFARRFKSPLNKSIYWLAPVILFFALMVFIRGSLGLAAINILLILYLLLLVVHLAGNPGTKLNQFGFIQYLELIISMPLRIARESFQFLLVALSNRSTTARKSSYAPVVRGILLSLPILFVFLLLLSSADLVFQKYIDALFDFSIAPETVFRWGLIGLVTSLFTGAYALIFMPTSTPETDSAPMKKRFDLGTTESSIILGSVSLLFFVFVVVQLAYLFGGSDQIASTGHTYAEYARKGFFELITVAAISLLLILTIKKSITLRTSKQTLTFKWLSGILIVEVMVIMLSAHMRLNLYEEAYGFTILRLWSHLFILWLAFAFSLLLFHIVKSKSDINFAFPLFISALCFFAVINLINPDAFIAKRNIDRFNEVGKIDLDYLSGLSEDATPAIGGLLDHPNAELQKSAANILDRQKLAPTRHIDDWQSANLARKRADQIFRDSAAKIEAGRTNDKLQELDINEFKEWDRE